MKTSPLAGHPVPSASLLDVAKLVTAYYAEVPDPLEPAQRVAFGTSGHRGSPFERTFNEWHVSAISEAPGNHLPIGGVKVTAQTGWFAARPSGTEDIYKIYAESYRGQDQLDRIVEQAQAVVDTALGQPR